MGRWYRRSRRRRRRAMLTGFVICSILLTGLVLWLVDPNTYEGQDERDSERTARDETGNPVAGASLSFVPTDRSAKVAAEHLSYAGTDLVRFGGLRKLAVTPELMFRTVSGREFVERLAADHGEVVQWKHGGRLAIMYPNTAQRDVERVLAGLRSADMRKRQDAAWLSRWVWHPRLVGPLLTDAQDSDPQLSALARRSLQSISWGAVMALEPRRAFALVLSVGEDRSATDRWDALEALEFAEGEQAVATLKKSLYDPAGDWHCFAAFALGKMKSRECLAVLNKARSSTSEATRVAALIALGRLGRRDVLADLRALMARDSRSVRCGAVSAFAHIEDEGAACALAKALKDKYPFVRFKAGIVLGRKAPGQAYLLLAKALQEGDEETRAIAARALVVVDNPNVRPLLMAALADKAQTVKVAAASSLARRGRARDLDALREVLAGGDKDTKRAVAEALGWTSGTAALELLKIALADEDHRVRLLAIGAALAMRSEDAVGLIRSHVKSLEPEVRGAIALRLGEIGGTNALGIIELLMADGDRIVRLRAVGALGQGGIPGETALARLQAALKGSDEALREGAPHALARLGGPRAFTTITGLLADDASEIRGAAALALGAWHSRWGGEEPLVWLEKALADKHPEVRSVAAIAMRGGEGETSRKMLIAALQRETLRPVRWGIIKSLRLKHSTDPEVKRLLQKEAGERAKRNEKLKRRLVANLAELLKSIPAFEGKPKNLNGVSLDEAEKLCNKAMAAVATDSTMSSKHALELKNRITRLQMEISAHKLNMSLRDLSESSSELYGTTLERCPRSEQGSGSPARSPSD
jgi:HEAT repeat protein